MIADGDREGVEGGLAGEAASIEGSIADPSSDARPGPAVAPDAADDAHAAREAATRRRAEGVYSFLAGRRVAAERAPAAQAALRALDAAAARFDPRLALYIQKWRWYDRNRLPWRRIAIHRHMLQREAFIRFPVQGNVLEALDDGRFEVGKHTLFEPQCWITIADEGRVDIGEGCFFNIGTMVAAQHRVTIGDHVMFANGCFVSDASHRYEDPDLPVPWQGFTSKGPVTIGSNCWFGVNCVVTTGVTIGERCVIGANSVVTRDLPPRVVAAGAPARVIREVEYPAGAGAPFPPG